MAMQLLGVDFTSAPTKRKTITVARGHRVGAVLRLDRIDAITTMAGFEALLAEAGPWFGAFDFPFGLPRKFVDAQGLGDSTEAVITALHQRCDVEVLVELPPQHEMQPGGQLELYVSIVRGIFR